MNNLTPDQQALMTIIQNSNFGGRSAMVWFEKVKQTNEQNAMKENVLHGKMVSYESRISGLDMVVKDHYTKIGNLEKLIGTINSLVQLDNENYAKNLSHTKSVLNTVQKVNQDLCTDTEFLRHEMEKIHSTLREVPKIIDEIRKIKVQLSDLNLELVSLKTPKQESNFHMWLFIASIVLSVLIGMYRPKTNYPMIGH